MYRHIRIGLHIPRPDALAVALFNTARRIPSGYVKLDKSMGGALSKAMKRPEFSARIGNVTTLYPDCGAQRVFVLGLGDPAKVTNQVLRTAAAKMLRAAHDAAVRNLEVSITAGLNGKLSNEMAGRAFGDGIAIANFDFSTYKGKAGAAAVGCRERPKRDPTSLRIKIDESLRADVRRAATVGQSVSLARRLAATPPNVANPTYLVTQCQALAKPAGLRCTVIRAARARQLKMGGLLAVGAAGSRPAALICLEHRPPHTLRSNPILLVGKAVTFDTGGYSIKPGANLHAMKYDKCGGVAVIGAMHAIARLKLPVHVVGLIPTVENMVSQAAYRPGDILTLCNGVTVEVINTDAEGRLILADALAYGCKAYKPAAVIDVATLTGGVVVALGPYCAGCFCRDAPLRKRLFEAAEFTGERLWHLPLWEEHREQIKGTHGDIVNSAGRDAHPIQGAAFLSHFIGPQAPTQMPDIPWAHLDIAGVSDVNQESPLFAKGPTGFGVRLLVRMIETWR